MQEEKENNKMGMDIFAIVFGVVAIGLGGFFFINETFIKKESDSDKISADAEKNNRES